MTPQIELSASERSMLMFGANEWGGPAAATDELALAMGFTDRDDLQVHGRRLWSLLKADEPMEAFDWARALVLTEFAFASDVFGSGVEWSLTTGLSDSESVETLRQLQRKLTRAGAGRSQFGPTIQQEFQWQRGAATAIRVYKRGRMDLQDLLASLEETLASFGDDLEELERTRAKLEELLDLPDDEQHRASLVEFDRLEAAIADRPGNPRRRWFFVS